jgi:pimeloyl-ACP methyl ester carboxylesterase
MTDSMPGPASHTFFSQRLRLHYVDWGNPDKPPLLLIHGGRDHCRNWDWTAAALRNDWHIIAPDLRGHGDSQWSTDGKYTMAGYIYDLAQLIHGQRLAPVTIVAHSLGGNVALRYAGIYPETVAKLVSIEGVGPSPQKRAERSAKTIAERMGEWIREQRNLAGRLPRRYASIEDAFRRMQEENPHLSAEQARHLTVHGVNLNEDGTLAGSSTTTCGCSRPTTCAREISRSSTLASPARHSCSTARRAGPAIRPRTGASSRSATPP